MQPLQICIGPIIRIGRESWCLPYAGFLVVVLAKWLVMVLLVVIGMILYCLALFEFFWNFRPFFTLFGTICHFLAFWGLFGIQLPICSPKMKFECAAQHFSPLPLDKHPTCLCLKFLKFLKKR